MSGRIRDEDVAYIRDRAPIDEVVADYVQLKSAGGGQKRAYVLSMTKSLRHFM
jgi:DNA primase